MRILLIMDPLIAVPPRHYGGIERVVADLADELVHRGHEVTLWAAPGSHIDGALEPFGHEGEWTRWSNARNTAVLTARFLRRPGAYDVVHNFGRLAYLTTVLSRNVPKVQTYMRRVNPDNMRRASSLGARRLHYTAVSEAIADTGKPGGGDWSVIYNCASPERYTCRTDTDPRTAPLVFLGRISYGAYLSHMPLLGIYLYYLRPINPFSVRGFVIFLVWFATVILVSWLSFRFIELPFLRIKNRLGKRQRVPAQVSLKPPADRRAIHEQVPPPVN